MVIRTLDPIRNWIRIALTKNARSGSWPHWNQCASNKNGLTLCWGSGSISQRYRSGSGSFPFLKWCLQNRFLSFNTKFCQKIYFLRLKIMCVWVSYKKKKYGGKIYFFVIVKSQKRGVGSGVGSGSGSISQRFGFGYPSKRHGSLTLVWPMVMSSVSGARRMTRETWSTRFSSWISGAFSSLTDSWTRKERGQ